MQLTSKKTALSSNTRPNKTLLSFIFNQNINKKEDTILDFGSGQGRHSNHLRSCGYSTFSYDPHHGSEDVNGWFKTSNKLPIQKVDYVFSTYVLNVVHPHELLPILNIIESLTSLLSVIVIRDDQSLKNLFKKPHKTYLLDGLDIPYIETNKGLQSIIPPAFLTNKGYSIKKGVSTIYYKNMAINEEQIDITEKRYLQESFIF